MAFKLIPAALTLALIFNLRVAANGSLHPMPIYDATPSQLESIAKTPFVKVPASEVNNWPQVHRTIMDGRGVEIQRNSKVQSKWIEFKKTLTLVELETHYAAKRKWLDKPESAAPEVLEKKFAKDPTWVQFVEAEYPINVPEGVTHYILWLHGSMTTPETFKPRGKENIPNKDWLNPDHVEELIEFIHAHDAFGSNVEATKYDRNLKVGEHMWVPPQELHHGYAGPVSMEEGIEAMQWSGRYITSLIEELVPNKEFAWFRINRSLRSFHVPNEVHVLVSSAYTPGARKVFSQIPIINRF